MSERVTRNRSGSTSAERPSISSRSRLTRAVIASGEPASTAAVQPRDELS